MKINNFTPYQLQFKSAESEKCPTCQTCPSCEKPNKEKSILDKFETSVRNSADMNDTIQVPRTIFKGYLSFCAGSALMPVASMIKNKFPKISNTLNVVNAGLIIYGTYSFVRPYLVTQEKESKKENIQPEIISEQKPE